MNKTMSTIDTFMCTIIGITLKKRNILILISVLHCKPTLTLKNQAKSAFSPYLSALGFLVFSHIIVTTIESSSSALQNTSVMPFRGSINSFNTRNKSLHR